MNKFLTVSGLLFAALLTGGCGETAAPPAGEATTEPAGATLSAETPAPPPADESNDAGPEDAAGAAAVTARCEEEVSAIGELVSRLERRTDDPTPANLLDPYNEILRRYYNGAYGAALMLNTHPLAEMRSAAGECQQRFSELLTAINLSRPIYQGFASIDVTDEDPETEFFVEKTLRDFRLTGVDRDEAVRQRIVELEAGIEAAGIEFNRNIAEDVRSITVDSTAALAGLPDDWVAARTSDDDGKIRVTTDYPDYIPFMRYAEDDALREALYREFNNRAYPANETVLKSLIDQRYELARLTGFDSWADRATADKMAGSAQAAREFIEQGSAATRARAEADRGILLDRLREIDPEAEAVMPWQSSRLTDLVRQERYSLDSSALRPYFEYSKVRDGIFELVGDLWDIRIEPREADVWHEDVGAYRMYQGDRLLGDFYLDMHPREGKFKHAAMFQIRTGVKDQHLPAAALVTNLPGGGGEKGYLEQQQVETFLHEFGHLVHWLTMNHQRWVANTTPEWDFIEAPSMMLQEWIYDTETLQRFASNDAGEAIPAELVEKMRRARDFGQGLFIHRQMYLAAVSLGFYDSDPAKFGLQERFEAITARFSLSPHVEGTHMYDAFGHLDGYSAYYYTYMWSLVIATDMFSRFEAAGLRDVGTARDYRDKVLAAGGSRPARDFVADFLGRPYNFEAFQRRLESGD